MVDAWSNGTPTPQQFPGRSSDGIGMLLDAVKDQGTRLREVASSLLTTAGLRVLPKKLASFDFDGTDRAHLGTAGWMLGSDETGGSYLALNGVDVIADLTAKAAYQASLISRDTVIAPFNTGTLTNDSAYHFVGSQAVISSIDVATGKLRITISTSEATTAPGTNTVIAIICFAIDGVTSLAADTQYARSYTAGNALGVPLVRVGTASVTPGTYTIRAQCAYWSAGPSSASINFAGLRLLAEVIGSD